MAVKCHVCLILTERNGSRKNDSSIPMIFLRACQIQSAAIKLSTRCYSFLTVFTYPRPLTVITLEALSERPSSHSPRDRKNKTKTMLIEQHWRSDKHWIVSGMDSRQPNSYVPLWQTPSTAFLYLYCNQTQSFHIWSCFFVAFYNIKCTIYLSRNFSSMIRFEIYCIYKTAK